MEQNELQAVVEALIYVSEDPITVNGISLALADDGVEKKEIKDAIGLLMIEYNEGTTHGVGLIEVGSGYQFRTKPEQKEWIQKLNVPKPTRLSQPAMETLAIVAYKQPVTRAEIEEVRGVDSGGVLKTLLERNLVKIVGKREEVGSPLIYSTSADFMSVFNLKTLKDLPTLRELTELEEQQYYTADETPNITAQEISSMIEDLTVDVKTDEASIEKEKLDRKAISSLDDEIKSIKGLEKEIFPKPKETIDVVTQHLTAASAQADDQPAPATEENTSSETDS
jgi:segregation and condensation protein B